MSSKKYGLVFEDKEEDCVLQVENSIGFLTEDTSKAYLPDEGRGNNVLIEGENYTALRCLRYSHTNKIDVIYIDPPYNTGNKDFVYNDEFIDEEDSFRHSKWLSFMKRRLSIAKELLSDRGVIFISIDDNELFQLKMLCDQIFGEKNFIANLIWKNKFNGGYDAQFMTIEHEYILCYAKNIGTAHVNYVPFNVDDDRAYRFTDEYVSIRGKYKVMNLDDKSLKYSDSLNFAIIAPDGEAIHPENCWRWGKDKVSWGIDNGFLSFVKDKGKWRVNKKQYQYCDNDGAILVRAYPLRSIIDGVSNTNSSNEIKDLFGDKTVFQYAKPVELIKKLLFVASQKDSIILDFFAGSGTTGQAVAELNNEDGGTRQFILITNNDVSDKLPMGICSQVTHPRLVKTIGKENLRYFRVSLEAEDSKHDSDHVWQLVAGNKLVDTLKLKYGTFYFVEETKEFSIFTNNDNSFYLSIWHKNIVPHKMSHQKKLNEICENNVIHVCRYDSYPREYLRVFNEK